MAPVKILNTEEEISETEEKGELIDPQEVKEEEVTVDGEEGEEEEENEEEAMEEEEEAVQEEEEEAEEKTEEEEEKVMTPEDHSRRGNADYFRTVDLEFLESYRQESGNTCLHIATSDGELECCKVIYDRCPELLFISNSIGDTVFHIIYGEIFNQKSDEPAKLLEFFLEVGKKITVEDTETMLRYRALLGQKNMYGKMAFLASAEYSWANTTFPEDDITDLWCQAERDYKLGLFRMTDNNNDSLLHWAVLHQSVYMVEKILEAEPDFVFGFNDSGDIPLWTALLAARWHDGPGSKPGEIRKLLLKHQPSQIAVPRGEQRWSALHYAVYEDDLGGVKDMIQNSPESMELVDSEGRNFLHVAAIFGKTEVVKLVLEAKGIPDRILNQSDNKGYTPLHHAAMTRKDDNEMVLCFLYDPRVDKTKTNNKGRSALEWITFDYDESRF